jgi:hypothetical protein
MEDNSKVDLSTESHVSEDCYQGALAPTQGEATLQRDPPDALLDHKRRQNAELMARLHTFSNKLSNLKAELLEEVKAEVRGSFKTELLAGMRATLDANLVTREQMTELGTTMNEQLCRMEQQINSLGQRLTLVVPTMLVKSIGGLVPLGGIDIVHGATDTYTCIKQIINDQERVFVLGAAHCAYWFGSDFYPGVTDRTFVRLPGCVVAAGVRAVYRHPDLKLGSPMHHNFVVVEIDRVPEGVEGPFAGWPLEWSLWEEAGVINGGGGVIGVSARGTVEGAYLTRRELLEGKKDQVGVFREIHGERGHSGTLLYSTYCPQPMPTPLGVYVDIPIAPNSDGFRGQGVCVPVPPLHSLMRIEPVWPTEPVSEFYQCRVSRKESRYCRLSSNGKDWVLEDGSDRHTGVVVADSHSFSGLSVRGAAEARSSMTRSVPSLR